MKPEKVAQNKNYGILCYNKKFMSNYLTELLFSITSHFEWNL